LLALLYEYFLYNYQVSNVGENKKSTSKEMGSTERKKEMIIIFHPEDLPKGCKRDKKRPEIRDFFAPESLVHLNPNDVVLYRYEGETIILKGPKS